MHVGPGRSQPGDQVPQIVVGPQEGGAGSVPQPDQQDGVVLGAGDGDGQVLVLLVEAVEEGQLLLPMRGIVKGVQVEGQ